MFAEIHIERGRIRAVLPNTEATVIRNETETWTVPGGHVLPGFVDNHAHIVGLGRRLTLLSLHDATSLEDCLDRIRTASTLGGWVQAMGWNQELWGVPTLPTTADLDRVRSDVPVMATRVDGHAMWCNSAALALAGISARESVLIDDDMTPVWSVVPKPTAEELEVMILAATEECARVGITEVHDMDVDVDWLEPMRLLAESGRLPVRVQSFVRAHNGQWRDWGLLPAGGEFLRICGVKLYADGALGSRGALLRHPYADAPDTYGLELLSIESIVQECRLALDAGWWSIAIHAIGDAAVRNVLDAYTVVRSWPDGGDVLLRIEHAQHVSPDDVLRMHDLHVFACVQPTHCLSDAPMAERRLGQERLADAYRWQSLISAGVRLGAGSDFPIEPPSPLAGIDAFVRRVPYGSSSTWCGDERISRLDAIRAFTSWAHATADMDHRRGTIAVGMDADLVILDRDILTCSDEELRDTCVLATFTAGKRRYPA